MCFIKKLLTNSVIYLNVSSFKAYLLYIREIDILFDFPRRVVLDAKGIYLFE